MKKFYLSFAKSFFMVPYPLFKRENHSLGQPIAPVGRDCPEKVLLSCGTCREMQKVILELKCPEF